MCKTVQGLLRNVVRMEMNIYIYKSREREREREREIGVYP